MDSSGGAPRPSQGHLASGPAALTSTAKVVDAAVTELDLRTGKAMVIAFVNRTVTPAGQQAVDKRERFQGDLTRTSSGWKLSNIVQVAVTQAGS